MITKIRINNNINRKQFFQLLYYIPVIFVFALIIFLSLQNNNPNVNACTGSVCCGTVGDGGCVYRTPCNSAEFLCQTTQCGTMCCDKGTCGTCTPSCGGSYSSSSDNGCSSTSTCCTRYNCIGESCGTTCITCWRTKYTSTFNGNGGSCSPGSRTVCGGSTANGPDSCTRSGYSLVNFSITSGTCGGTFTASTGSCTNMTYDITVTANWTLSNSAPTAPTNLLAEGLTNPVGVTDLTPEFSAIFNDPDTSEIANYYEIEVNTNSGFTGTVMWDTGQTSMANLSKGSRMPDKSYAGTALSLNGVTYYWRIRFWDDDGAQGAWSAVATFAMNTAPSSPTNLWTEGQTNPTGLTDLTPEFSAQYNDPDSGDLAVNYQIEVNTNSGFTGTVMWNSGKTSMTSVTAGDRMPDKSYAGTALSENGTTYYWRIRFWDDSDTEGSVSAVAQFTMNTPPSQPTNLLAEGEATPLCVVDTTPEFSAIFNDPNTGDTGNYYQINVNTASNFGGTSMWDSNLQSMTATAIGTRSPDISYAGTTLTLSGNTYYWRILFGDNHGTTGSWSGTSSFRMDSAPTSPTGLLTEGATNPATVYDTTPEFSAIFNDNDSGNTGTYYEIHVNTASDFNGSIMWESGLQSMTPTAIGARSPDISYAGTALTANDARYYWRVRFADNCGITGAWSATGQFDMSNIPTAIDLLTEGVTNPQKVLDATPEFSAIFSDPDTPDTGNYYEIEVNTASNFSGTVMWDSNKLSTGPITNGNRSPDYSYAGTALSTTSGLTYYWRIRFWDNYDFVSNWSSVENFIMNGAPTAPTALLADNQTNPTLISSITPTFSAIHHDPNGDSASAYEIEVNSNSGFSGTVMWDTDKVSTTVNNNQRSPDYTYAGTELTRISGITYYWRIRFWDSDDQMGAWSATATFRDLSVIVGISGVQMRGIQIK